MFDEINQSEALGFLSVSYGELSFALYLFLYHDLAFSLVLSFFHLLQSVVVTIFI